LYYQYPTPDYSMDDRVGMALSHGCVRLRLENAKWIYDNIPYGTKVVSY
jgi:lipoprotein-anchoring transpeptidase ErfK/SrfK